MRAWSAPVVLSSAILGGWLTAAGAQTTQPSAQTTTPTQQAAQAQQATQSTQAETPPALMRTYEGQNGTSENAPPGVIPRPTLAEPGLVVGTTLGEIITDNVGLQGSGQPKQTSWITQIQPFVRWAYNRPRFQAMLSYRLNGYLYAGHSSRDHLQQHLHAQGLLTVMPQHLFLDGFLQYGRRIINSSLPAGSGSFFIDDNHANVMRGTLSPYWVQDMGSVGTAVLRYIYGRVDYSTRGIPDENGGLLNEIPDYTSNGVQFTFVSPQQRRLGWNLSYTDQHIEPAFGRHADFAVAKLGGFLALNGNTHLLADAGRENRFEPDGTVDKLGSNLWDVGIEWSNALNHFKLMAGHRFYGPRYDLSWTHTAARLTTRLRYLERPTDLNQQLLGFGQNFSFGATSSLGNRLPIFPSGSESESGSGSFGEFGIPSLTERRIYLMKRATASVAYEMPNGTLQLRLYDERRHFFFLNTRSGRVDDADASWRVDLGPFTWVTPKLGWRRYQHEDGQVSYLRYGQLEAVHRFGPNDTASLRLRRRTSTVFAPIPGAHGYNVDVIYFHWTHLF